MLYTVNHVFVEDALDIEDEEAVYTDCNLYFVDADSLREAWAKVEAILPEKNYTYAEVKRVNMDTPFLAASYDGICEMWDFNPDTFFESITYITMDGKESSQQP